MKSRVCCSVVFVLLSGMVTCMYCGVVLKYLKAGIDPNVANADGLTALHQVLTTVIYWFSSLFPP